MSVIGIDIGSNGAVMASVRGGKIQVIRNEISDRTTPCMVSYTSSGERISGDQALNAINSNYRCTARNMKCLLGRRATPDFLAQQKNYSLAPISAGPGGHVQYDLPTTDHPISVVQATSSFLMKLTHTAKTFLEAPTLGGAVISVPAYYSQSRIQCLADSAALAKVHLLNCVKEYMAVAMDYGIYRRKTFDEVVPTVTAFVSIGHGYTSVTIAEFTQHYGKILTSAVDEELGGRRLDDIIINMMSEKFKKETGLDASSNARSRLKLETAASKAKKTLSSNKEAPYNLECLLDGEDLNGMLKQSDLVELASPMTVAMKQLCFNAMSLLPEGCVVSSVELVGNGSRAPIFYKAVEEAFNMTAMRTLSADETVARGCALYAALFSPTVRMKEYPIFDWMNPVPNKLRNPPKPVEKPASEGLLKGFFTKKPAADASAEPTDATAETTADADMTPEEEVTQEEETIPNQTPENSPLAPEEPVEEAVEEEEDLTPIATPVEDPDMVAEVYKPGHIRAFEEQELAQAKKDTEAAQRKVAINEFESTIFFCRDRCRGEWNSMNPNAVLSIQSYLDDCEEFIWDHMMERFSVYEDKLDDLKHHVGQWFDDFKPKPPAPVITEPEPATAEATAEPAAEATESKPEETFTE